MTKEELELHQRKIFLPKHDVSEDYTIEATKRVAKILEDDGFK